MEKDYIIHGVVHTFPSISFLGVTYHVCDLINIIELERIIKEISPDEIYNFGAISDAVVSTKYPEETMLTNANSVTTICRIISNSDKKIKLFQAGSVEMFKGTNQTHINEHTLEMYPKNPYAIAKMAAYWMVRYYREQKNCYVCNGIIFNAESKRRNSKFVTRKITNELRQITQNNDHIMSIGNMAAERDWIHAYDVANAAWLMLQQNIPEDYMICLGKNHTVKEFIEITANKLKIDLRWSGTDVNEIGVDQNGRTIIKIDPQFFRGYETNTQPLIGDNSKLKNIGWVPKYDLLGIISDMLE